MVWKCICCCNSPKSVLRPCAILCHPKPNSLTVSENAQIRFILRFILLFSEEIVYLSAEQFAFQLFRTRTTYKFLYEENILCYSKNPAQKQ